MDKHDHSGSLFYSPPDSREAVQLVAELRAGGRYDAGTLKVEVAAVEPSSATVLMSN